MPKPPRTPAVVLAARTADDDHEVLSVEGGSRAYRRKPCQTCPWVVDEAGKFPPEAFVLAAGVARDMADSMFACHESGKDNPCTCAGFLLRGAAHNLAYRLAVTRGRLDPDLVREDGRELHPDYRTMAIANGVPPDHPCLTDLRNAND